MRRATRGIILAALLCACPAAVYAGATDAASTEPAGERAFGSATLWPSGTVSRMLDDLARAAAEDPPPAEEPAVEYLQPGESGYKSPGRAFFMSLLVPGFGELYSGSKRGLAFLGLELLSWGGYYYYDKKGEDKRTEYQDYADEHYDPARYRDLINEICGKYENWPNDPDWPCMDCEYEHCREDVGPGEGYSESKCGILRGHFILPEEKGQHYYEDLGKYDKYIFGWDDWYEAYEPNRDVISWSDWEPGVPWPVTVAPWDESIGMRSAHRESYRQMRRDSNDALDRATYFTWFVVVNHVASALDAAFMARNHNRRLAGEPANLDVCMDACPLGEALETRMYIRRRF